MTLLLVRHAQSVGNAAGRIQGWRDEPLTELGRAQAAAVADRLATHETGVVAVYSSTLARARDTGAPLAAALGLPLIQRADLREYGYGAAEGLDWAAIEGRFGLTVGQWGQGVLPGEEGPATFDDRVGRCLAELAGRHEHEVAAVVTHGGVVTRIVALVLGIAGGAPPHVYLANGSLTVVATERGEHALVALNDDCHLATITPEAASGPA